MSLPKWFGEKSQFGMFRKLIETVACIISISMSASCSLAPAIDLSAIEYNKTFAETGDKLLILNILRASDDLPLHFSRYESISGNLETSVNAGTSAQLAISQGSRLLNYILTPEISARVSSSPNFSISNLDTDEIYKGLLTPITPETFTYYWDRGFPKEILTSTLIENISVKLNSGRICFLDNYPPAPKKFNRFKTVVQYFTGQNPVIQSESGPEQPYGPPIAANLAGNLGALVEARKANLGVSPRQDAIQLTTTPTRYTIKLPNGIAEIDRTQVKPHSKIGRSAGDEKCDEFDPGQIRQALIRLRSVQGVIYYLGELARVQIKGDNNGQRYVPTVAIADGSGKQQEVIFRLIAGPQRGPLNVSYRGVTYGIPDGDQGKRSRQALSLLNEILSLNLKGSALPQSQTILIAN